LHETSYRFSYNHLFTHHYFCTEKIFSASNDAPALNALNTNKKKRHLIMLNTTFPLKEIRNRIAQLPINKESLKQFRPTSLLQQTCEELKTKHNLALPHNSKWPTERTLF
jgi:hypothetical protein